MASPSADRSPAILCAGIAVQDFVMRVENFPAPGAKVYASEYVTIGGGCAANAATTVARLTGKACFAGPLGDQQDSVSTEIVTGLEKEHIDCGGVVRAPGAKASVSLILLDAKGEKQITTRRGQGLDNVTPRDASKLVASIDAVLADNRFPTFVTPICEAARLRNIPVVIDLDQATEPNHPLLKLGTHVIASAEGLRGTFKTDDVKAALSQLAQHLPGFAAVTDGPDGVHFMKGSEVRHLPAFTVDAVDTLGAGDTFHGAFTVALAERGDVIQAMRFAAAAAAIKCTRFGGQSGAPTKAEVLAFLGARAAR